MGERSPNDFTPPAVTFPELKHVAQMVKESCSLSSSSGRQRSKGRWFYQCSPKAMLPSHMHITFVLIYFLTPICNPKWHPNTGVLGLIDLPGDFPCS